MSKAPRNEVLRIGNAGGYWGDDPTALERQVFGGRLDYISMDFLAEVTMSIMQKQRHRDPAAGYARDFLPMLEAVLAKTMKDGTRIITNAGGVNPEACAKQIEELAKRLGLKPKIAIVYGDDILPDIQKLRNTETTFQNMETGENFEDVADRLESANIYFGAAPVVEALKWEPDIIITGRVTDTGITVAPMIHEFGWELDDYTKIAHGIVSGHLMECGSQATGGNFSDWDLVPSFNQIGYPISEISPDGSFVLTKHEGTGGLVSVDTVREQLFYEMGNPKEYITPDVVADFTSIRLRADGDNRVHVSGIQGYEPTRLYKVSMAYRDGYRCVGSILISGPNARDKAETFADMFWEKAGPGFVETHTEYLGWNACHGALGHKEDGNEILLRLGARSQERDALRKFGKLIPSLILGGPPGVAVVGGVPRAQDVVSYWPALMTKELVHPRIALYSDGTHDEKDVTTTRVGDFGGKDFDVESATEVTQSVEDATDQGGEGTLVSLHALCLGRSGDKGDMANVGILARNETCFEFLDSYLSAQRMKNFFQEKCRGPVMRYKLEGLLGFNFLLEASLGGGGTRTLQTDAQGKTYAQAVLAQKVRVPQDVADSLSSRDLAR